MMRPYGWSGDEDDPVDMVRHDNEFIDLHTRKMCWNLAPDLPDRRCETPAFEHALPLIRADGDEVSAILPVVPTGKPDGAAVVDMRGVSHRKSTLSDVSRTSNGEVALVRIFVRKTSDRR